MNSGVLSHVLGHPLCQVNHQLLANIDSKLSKSYWEELEGKGQALLAF